MKSLISILTATVLCLTLMGGATLSLSAEESGDGGYDIVLFEDGFESAVQGNTDSDSDGLAEGNITISYSGTTETWALSMASDNKEKALHTYESADAERGSKGLALYEEGQSYKWAKLTPSTMTDGYSHVKYEFEISVPEGARQYIRYNEDANIFVDVDARTSQKRIRLFDGSAGGTGVAYNPGDWVKIGVVINTQTNTSDLYVNNVYENSMDIPVDRKLATLIQFSTATSTAMTTPTLIDNVKISVPSALNVVSTLPANGATDIAPNTTYTITGSRNLNKYDITGLAVTDSTNAEAGYTYAISGKDVTLTFDSFLKLNETYTVTFNGASYTFTTEGEVPESIYYPAGMTWDTMQYHADGVSLANSSAWMLNNITGDNISIETEANGNKYASVTGPTNVTSYSLRHNIGVEYKSGESYNSASRYIYYTMQIAGWEDDYSEGNLTISPRYVNSSTAAEKSPNAPVYLATGGTITSSGGKTVAVINPIQESSSLQDKFYRIDIIIDMHTSTYYIYLDGQKVKEYAETTHMPSYTGIKYFEIAPAAASGSSRCIKLDNVGYKVYSSTATLESILEEVFPVDRIISLSAYALDADNAEGRRYRVVIRGSADEGAGSYFIAAYDASGKMLDVRNLNGIKNENETSVTMGTYTRNGSFVTDIVHGVGLDSLSEVKTIKAFLIDTNGFIPVVECATLDSSRFN